MSDCRITSTCEEVIKEATASGGCPEFSVCLPFGGRLYSEGGCVNYEEGTPPPDGVYSKVVVSNGCIVGLELADLPLYTSSPCAPVPVPCDCEGGGGSSLPDPSVTTGNLFQYDASGRPLVLLSARAGDGVSITGRGTSADPLIISSNPGESAGIQIRGTNLITVEGDGSADAPYRISHKTNGTAQSVMGMTFDDAGHLTGYTPSQESGVIRGIIDGRGITVDTDTAKGIATVNLAEPLVKAQGDYTIGGYRLKVDANNIIYEIKQVIDFPAGVYRMGLIDVTVNEYGSITSVSILDESVVSTSACRQFTGTATAREITFTTDKVSSFHIVYTGTALPTGMTAYVDGTAVAGLMIPLSASSRFEAMTPALYSAGQHTVRVQASADIPAGFLTVTLATAV